MSPSTDRPGPTRRQRVAILLASHLLTLASLVACTAGQGSSATPAGGTAAALPSARADVTVIGNGYVVQPRDWQPPQAAGAPAPPPVLPLATPQPAPRR